MWWYKTWFRNDTILHVDIGKRRCREKMPGPQFTGEQRSFIALTYHRTQSPQETINEFVRRFPGVNPPHRNTVRFQLAKYKNHHTSLNRNRGNSGRPRTARSVANVDRVRQELQNHPTVSVRRNHCYNISKSTFSRIASRDLNWHPYKIQRRHALKPEDYQRRVNFSNWLLNRPARFYETLIIGDEASFPMDGRVSTHNVRRYAPRNAPPQDFTYDVPNDKRKVTVWIGLMGNNTLIGPVFFRNNVNGEDMINNHVVTELERLHYQRQRNGAFPRLWWAQDGAPPHRYRPVHGRLQTLFPNRVIGLGHDPEWPARSPDLNPLDFFLWGYLKARVYRTPPASPQDLENRIRAEVRALRRRRGMIRRGVRDMESRARRCINRQGRHIEGRAGR